MGSWDASLATGRQNTTGGSRWEGKHGVGSRFDVIGHVTATTFPSHAEIDLTKLRFLGSLMQNMNVFMSLDTT